MENIIADIAAQSIQLYALMTPPAVLSAFLGHTKKYDAPQKNRIAFRTSLAIFIIGLVLYLFGSSIFELFGFTLDAFRIGSGVLLMLTAIGLMRDDGQSVHEEKDGDISVVPLAIPLGMGPASIGAVMVLGADAKSHHELIIGIFSLFLAALGMYALLRVANIVGRILHATGIAVMAKLTGLLLAAIAAQVVFTGVVGFLK